MSNNLKKFLSKNKKTLILIAAGVASGGLIGYAVGIGGTALSGSILGAIAGGSAGAAYAKKTDSLKEEPKRDFSLSLIISSDKLKTIPSKGKIDLDKLKDLINNSGYFLLSDIPKDAKISETLPDSEKSSNFILQITGQGKADIDKYPTKSWLRDNIIPETCDVQKVLHLLDASIAQQFARTI